MALTAGTRVGPYEIGDEIGAGGMGNVYRATDTRLGRDVAIKTIKGPFTERFEREARAISSLNHPHICTLFDVGDHEGSGYLVMEHVEGRPLAGPLPPDQAITYGIQICEALHAAHRKGIVHRDLKPANILLTKQGVKLLDFGLAKVNAATSVAGGTEAGAAAERATIAALTGAHTVVGTPQYMAPEQISGGEVDARTDIFAFGCVLYELLTGRRAFDGKTMSSVMASVLASKPEPIESLVPLTPPALERVVSRCLAKDPDDRWQSAKDIAEELRWIAQGGSRVGLPVVVASRRKVREWLAWTACGVAALAAVGFAAAWVGRAHVSPPLVRFAVAPPPGLASIGPPAVSPDGQLIAFDGTDENGQRQIWIRPLDALDPRPVSGTEGGTRPFWSPDSRFIAFMAGGKLKRVTVAGGSPQTVCDAPSGSDGSWGSNGDILFDGRASDPIYRVSANGGVPKPAVPTSDTASVGWPEFLPDGRRFLYTTVGGGPGPQTVMAGTLDSTEAKELLTSNSRVLYAPGYLLYVREQTLVAHPFDAARLEMTGEPIPIGEGLGVDSVGLASFSISRTGVLVFRPGGTGGTRLLWADRSGNTTPVFEGIPGDYRDAWLSPDGARLVFDLETPGGGDLWIRDLVRGVTSRFTFESKQALDPIWSPDGRQIVFAMRNDDRTTDLFLKDASGTREPELLLKTDEEKYPSDWTRDGSHIVYLTRSSTTSFDLWALPMSGDRKPFPLVRTRFAELFGTVSPDGRYLAYSSDESGRLEVYVHEFPEPRGKWQVSTNGGSEPFWRADGRELYYRAAADLMAVSVQTSPAFVAGNPAALFRARFATTTVRGRYRPLPDGKRFLVLGTSGADLLEPLVVVLNWTHALRH